MWVELFSSLSSHNGEDILDWNLQFGELDKQTVFSAAPFLLEE